MSKNAARLSLLPKVRCYGKSAALCVEASTTRDLVETVMLEVGVPPAGKGAWHNKIQIQITATELPLLAAVLLGLLPKLEIKRSGKGIILERQPGRLYVVASQTHVLRLPVVPGRVVDLSALVLNQLQKNHPETDPATLMLIIRAAAQMAALALGNNVTNAI